MYLAVILESFSILMISPAVRFLLFVKVSLAKGVSEGNSVVWVRTHIMIPTVPCAIASNVIAVLAAPSLPPPACAMYMSRESCRVKRTATYLRQRVLYGALRNCILLRAFKHIRERNVQIWICRASSYNPSQYPAIFRFVPEQLRTAHGDNDILLSNALSDCW